MLERLTLSLQGLFTAGLRRKTDSGSQTLSDNGGREQGPDKVEASKKSPEQP